MRHGYITSGSPWRVGCLRCCSGYTIPFPVEAGSFYRRWNGKWSQHWAPSGENLEVTGWSLEPSWVPPTLVLQPGHMPLWLHSSYAPVSTCQPLLYNIKLLLTGQNPFVVGNNNRSLHFTLPAQHRTLVLKEPNWFMCKKSSNQICNCIYFSSPQRLG